MKLADITCLAMSLIRKQGVRVTDARIKVVEVLLSQQRALSHQEINDLLGPGNTLEKVTLYRTLGSLVKCGMLSKVSSEDRAWRFRLRHGAGFGEHYQGAYFHCLQCSARSRLDDSAFAVPEFQPPTNYRVTEIELTVRGICPACNKNEKNLGIYCNLVAFMWLAKWVHAENMLGHLALI